MTRQEELEAMTEFEINCLVAAEIEPSGERTFKDYDLEEIRICYDRICIDGSVNTDFDIVDYCNNPSDIMPIAIENKMSQTFNIACPDLGWEISAYEYLPPDDFKEFRARHENPCRAICIVFILISEAN